MEKEYRDFYYKYLYCIESDEEEFNKSVFNKKPILVKYIGIISLLLIVFLYFIILSFKINRVDTVYQYNVSTSSYIYKIIEIDGNVKLNKEDFSFIANVLLTFSASIFIALAVAIIGKYFSNLNDWKTRYWNKLYKNIYYLKKAFEDENDMKIWLHNYKDTSIDNIQASIHRQSEVIYLMSKFLLYLLKKRLIKCSNISIKEELNKYLAVNRELTAEAIKNMNEDLFNMFKSLHSKCSYLVYDLFNDINEKLGDNVDKIKNHIINDMIL